MPVGQEIGFVKAVSSNKKIWYDLDACWQGLKTSVRSNEACKLFRINRMTGIINFNIWHDF